MAEKATAKPKKKPYLTVGVPGGKSSGGVGVQPNLIGTMSSKNPVGKTSSPSTQVLPGGSAPPGRPPSNLGKYLVKPTDTSITGFEMLNEDPTVLDAVHEKFTKQFELPTHLRPTRFLAPTLEHGRALNISRGFRAPRSRHG